MAQQNRQRRKFGVTMSWLLCIKNTKNITGGLTNQKAALFCWVELEVAAPLGTSITLLKSHLAGWLVNIARIEDEQEHQNNPQFNY